MHQKHGGVVELREEILGAAAERCDLMPLQPRDEALWQGKAQVRPPLLDARDRRTLENRRQTAPDRLHFRKLGHRSAFSLISAP